MKRTPEQEKKFLIIESTARKKKADDEWAVIYKKAISGEKLDREYIAYCMTQCNNADKFYFSAQRKLVHDVYIQK